MRHHGSPVRHPPPWVALSSGRFLTSFQGRSARSRRLVSFPKDATCFGSTGSWLLLDIDAENNTHRCHLHDPFTGTTVPRPELDNIIGNVVNSCYARRVLMRGGPEDLVALRTTDSWDYPFVLARSGIGASVPKEPMATLRIIDIAFLEGKLYGITKAQDLYFFDIGCGDDGVPIVTSTQSVIEHPASDIDEAIDEEDDEVDTDDENNEFFQGINGFDSEEEDNDSDDDEDPEFSDDDEDSEFFNDCEELIFEGTDYTDDGDFYHKNKFRIFIVRHLVESRGKLFMVKQHLQCRLGHYKDNLTRKVKVFEADINAGAWIPMVNGLGGQALFIGTSLIKFVPACGEIEEDAVYFIDTCDMFSIRSQTNKAIWWDGAYWNLMQSSLYENQWIFPPDLVV
jgi:hypothetical protein